MVQLEAGDQSARLEHFIVENVLSELIERYGRGFVVNYDRQNLLGLITPGESVRVEQFQEEVKTHLTHYLKILFRSSIPG